MTFGSKMLTVTLLEVDPTGKSALDVGSVQLDLAQFASADPSATTTRALMFTLAPGISSACALSRALARGVD